MWGPGACRRAHPATSPYTSGRSLPMELAEGSPTKGAKQMSTVAGETMTAYVVRGADGRVVVAFWGESALEEADRWLERDYRVDRLELPVE